MSALCVFFPGADEPINYDDCEEDESESLDEDYVMYDTRDSIETDTEMSQTIYQNSNDTTNSEPVKLRNSNKNHSPRPRSFVETQVSKLQNLIAAETYKPSSLPKEEEISKRIGPVNIPQHFRRPEFLLGQDSANQSGQSPVTINRTSSSPVDKTNELITPQDTLRIINSPVVFSESSSPRRLSPIVNYNIGNMNPMHISWNKDDDKLSPVRSPSVYSNSNSTVADNKDDLSSHLEDRHSASNSSVGSRIYQNGNPIPRLSFDPKFQVPLQISVDPVSDIMKCFFTDCLVLRFFYHI